ncbi:hypothetical protein DVH24_031684 [Malus domestica]|uniref:Uncharacterized protein n=1 Tax=Malus domestica TaxID=3750 RepID=A0A498J3Y5_MALDO|nr:hypothetical protein DVH24_031684 [Malus domestica]
MFDCSLQEATREQKLALEISAAKEFEKSRALSAIDERLKKSVHFTEKVGEEYVLVQLSQISIDIRQRAEEDSRSNLDLSDSQLEHQVIHRFRQKKPVANNAAKTKSRLSGDVLSAVSIVLLCCNSPIARNLFGMEPDSKLRTTILVASVISESSSSSETKSNEKRLVLESPSTFADRILNSYKPNVSEKFSP